mgnify:CR=1 FL=1
MTIFLLQISLIFLVSMKNVNPREMCRDELTGSLIKVGEKVIKVLFEVKARRSMKVFAKK